MNNLNNIYEVCKAILAKMSGGSGSSAKITLKQGGAEKGFFTLDEQNDKTINLDAGGSGSLTPGETNTINITDGHIDVNGMQYQDLSEDVPGFSATVINNAITIQNGGEGEYEEYNLIDMGIPTVFEDDATFAGTVNLPSSVTWDEVSIPTPPSADGSYVLVATIQDGELSYS